MTDIALAIPVRDDRLLVARRAEGLHLAGHWEFPGGKVDAGEDPADAARRELREETSLDAGKLEPLAVFVHEYPDRTLRFHVFLARDAEGDVKLDGDREWAWKGLAELRELQMPPANVEILSALRWRIADS